MLKFFSLNYKEMSKSQLEEVFTLRKLTFKDRLDWEVTCCGDREQDQYDATHTDYILGLVNNSIACSARLIDIHYPTMITGPFSDFFGEVALSEGCVESSRFFIDKARSKKHIPGNSISQLLFLAVINYSRAKGYKGVLTVVSHPMYIILKRSGWVVTIVKKAYSEKNQPVYLLHLPTDDKNQDQMIDKVIRQFNCIERDAMKKWPLTIERV